MKKLKSVMVVLILLGMIVLNAQATIVDLVTSADSDIRSNAVDYAKGNRIEHSLLFNWTPVTVHLYVQFQLPDDFDTATATTFKITSANVYNPGWNYQYDVYGLNDNVAGNDWQELSPGTYTGAPSGGLTWNNAPGNNTVAANNGVISSQTTLLGTITEVDDLVEISLSSSSLLNFINSDTDKFITFILVKKTQASFSSSFVSREGAGTTYANANAPTLTLEYIPEPATIILLSIGGLITANRRRIG